MLGGDHHQVQSLDGDVEEGVLLRLHIRVLLRWLYQLREGSVDLLDRVLRHALELPRKGQLSVLVADAHRQDHHSNIIYKVELSLWRVNEIRVKLSFCFDFADLHDLCAGQFLLALLAGLHGGNCYFKRNIVKLSCVRSFRHGLEKSLTFS